jgi:hypothetical protein
LESHAIAFASVVLRFSLILIRTVRYEPCRCYH